MIQNISVIQNIRNNYDQMFSAEKKVADYILENPESAVMANVSELANLSGVSDATIIRMCKHIGYQGFYQMKIKLSNDLGRSTVKKNLLNSDKKPNTVQGLFELFSRNLKNIADNLNLELLLECARMIKNSKRVHIAAAGNTAPIASDLGFRLGRFGIKTTYSLIAEYYLNHISLAEKDEMVIGITRSGSSKQVLQALELAKQKGLKTIVITGTECSPVAKFADYTLLTKCNYKIFNDRSPDSHLYEMATIDALLYFLVNGETIEQQDADEYDDVEMLLAEYKL